jgi:hypothetical protein
MPERINSISFLSFLVVFLVIIISCKEKYQPDINSSSSSYLVVEGVLNTGGPTTIRISRTTKLDNQEFIGEAGANVTVEGKDNTTRQLLSNGNGIYNSPDLGLSLGGEYRLRIQTNGKEYLSGYVTARQTPVIDSINWRQEGDGLHLFVGTHDPSNNTRYYRWEYDETWEIRSYYGSTWKYIPDSNIVRSRFHNEKVFAGWKFDSFKSILLGSSASLQSDIIFRGPVNFIPSGDEKLSVRYSILIRQYALDKAGYAFYELMKKNTEELGTIFDAQPSEVKGNIHNVDDPDDHVIGYITASSVAEKRIFIANSDLVAWRFRQDCPTLKVLDNPDSLRAYFQGGYLPISFDGTHYESSFGRCVDVTLRGATLIKPAYW